MTVLSDGKISWARSPKVCVILHLPQLKRRNTCSFEGKKRGEKNLKERHLRWQAVDNLLNRDIDEFRLRWELAVDATDVWEVVGGGEGGREAQGFLRYPEAEGSHGI